MTDRVALVVVTHQSRGVVDRLLDSVPAATQGLDVRVVVVDNASTDGTAAHVRERGVEVVEAPNHGYAAGINRGAAVVEPDRALLALNPDVVLAPGSVAALLEASAARPDIGMVVPRVLDDGGGLSLSLRREPTLANSLGLAWTGWGALSEYVVDPAAYESAGPVDWAVGAVVLVSPRARALLGPWDESFFLYSEETEYCLRARDHGLLTWYVPDAVVTHVGGASGRSPRTHAMQVVNRVRLYARRGGPAPLAFLALTALREAVWIPRRGRYCSEAVLALLRPSRRPPELGLDGALIPR